MRERSPLPTPEIQAIINAWVAGDYTRAIALTNEWQRRSQKRVCKGRMKDGSPCTRVLAKQAKGDYCKQHRHQDPRVKESVSRSRKKKQAGEIACQDSKA